MKVKSESEVTQSCPTLSHPMDWSLPGSSVHGIFQARVLEWGAIAFSDQRGYQMPKRRKRRRLLRIHKTGSIHWYIHFLAKVDYKGMVQG